MEGGYTGDKPSVIPVINAEQTSICLTCQCTIEVEVLFNTRHRTTYIPNRESRLGKGKNTTEEYEEPPRSQSTQAARGPTAITTVGVQKGLRQ